MNSSAVTIFMYLDISDVVNCVSPSIEWRDQQQNDGTVSASVDHICDRFLHLEVLNEQHLENWLQQLEGILHI